MTESARQERVPGITTPEANQRTVQRFYDEVWNKGNLDVADEIVAADAVRHDLRPTPIPPGAEGQKVMAGMFRAAFPDCRMTIDFMVADTDRVVGKWTITGTNLGSWLGKPATGALVSFTGVNIFRFAAGQVVEIWNFRDDLGLMQQLAAGTPSS